MPRHRNGGIRKRCPCPRRNWAKCPHGWHLNYRPKGGPHYRLSLDRKVGRHIDSKTEAQAEAERIRTEIRNGTFRRRDDFPGATEPARESVEMYARRHWLPSAELNL